MSEDPTNLTANFQCLYAPDFELSVELIGDDRVQGLEEAWAKAFEHYNFNGAAKMQKQLKRKLGSIYNFHDLSNVVIRFMRVDGKRDEIRVNTDYALI